MSPARLLEHFDRLIDTPDAVPRLRRFILDLAVRGKLVEQDPKDEPAGELLKRIAKEKIRLARTGKTGRSKLLPFSLPQEWRWVRIGEVSRMITKGSTPTSYGHSYVQSGINFIKVEAIKNGELLPENVTSHISAETHEFLRRSQLEAGDFLFSIAGSIGTCAVVPESILPANTNQALAIIRGSEAAFHSGFLKSATSSSLLDSVLAHSRGGAMNNISLEDVSNFLLPVPPLAEQHRIVARVDELMALCDELEAAQTKREKRRDRLVATTLHDLNNGDTTPTPGAPTTFEKSARFYFNHLPRFTTCPEHIHQLRQTILNLAVRGSLVPQDPKDEPSSKLLIRLSSGKKQIIEELGLRQQPELSEERDKVVPFHAPAAWVWSVMDECFIVTGGIQKTPLRTPRNHAFPYVGVSNVLRGRLDLSEVKQFELKEGELDKLRLEPDDLLVVEGNGSASEVGRCARWTGEIRNCVHQNHIIRCRAGDPAIARFTEIYLNSETGVEIMRALAVTSAGLYNLSVGKIRRIKIPIPPIAEQHRIVAMADKLMTLCDEIEAGTNITATAQRLLLHASLLHALPA